MSPVARDYVSMESFAGLVTNIDGGEEMPVGAMEWQTNLMCRRPGLLETRPGLITVIFEDN